MKTLRLITFVVLAICMAASARADESSKRAKVHELFAVLHTDQTVDQVMNTVMKQVSANTAQMTGATELPPEAKAKLDDFQKQVFALVSNQVGWQAMEPEYTELYVQTYTEQELDGILAFYKSPEGASMIAKTPGLVEKSVALSQERMKAVMPQLMQLLQEFAKRMKSPAPAANSAPAAK